MTNKTNPSLSKILLDLQKSIKITEAQNKVQNTLIASIKKQLKDNTIAKTKKS